MAPAQPADEAAHPAGAVTPRPLLLIGGGEHASVVFDAAATQPTLWRVLGFTDPRADPGTIALAGIPNLGDDRTGLAVFDTRPSDERPVLVLAMGGVGDPAERRRVADAIAGLASWAGWAVIVHQAAWVAPSAELADGTVVLAGAIVNAGARIGPHAIVNSRAVVEHDVRIGAFVHVGPGAVVGGGTSIGSNVTIGLGALVRDHISVGDGAVIGMGAVVVADVPPGATVIGSPARPRLAPAGPGVRA
jgi:sugar O-acyltransferase (sialic acid O-acetyltransferase NeuD family)